ncbi:UreD urease accessory protein-domain-containing protein [Neohortaea acidophila]|uniref:UreD urease accessory protein-domain-containing protein n=1 Tax=Neohortaea acidophila TaxID=245834 RepID=A0A6A6Q1Z2_9PEZI|nr:UreD urease accessory protein-domain-containing protein [Neohortaea acidophila]KAF2486302.1 UreD urease accessory protein-domain-containing protein [Neohortaea acidophila]
MSSTFASPPSTPGNGIIHLALLPPNTPRLKTVKYQYPLKLISPGPLRTADEPYHSVHTVYLLTYGGGLVAGDTIDLHIILEQATRLVLLTQGSTKLFKSPSRDIISKQNTVVDLALGSALCFLPDPIQPFEKACFEQRQIYNLAVDEDAEGVSGTGSLCVLDWVCNGRPANGENWSFLRYGSKNEIYLCPVNGKRRLLLRDSLLLDDEGADGSVVTRMDGLGVYGTLILYGSVFRSLGQFFMDEFSVMPRIGGRKWDSGSEDGEEDVDEAAMKRAVRQRQELADGLLWSVASVRGCVVVKFGAKEVEGGRKWLRTMLIDEGSVWRELGERALLCLR